MHTQPMSELDGKFNSEKKVENSPCYKCKQYTVYYTIWESSCGGYEDFKYTCKGCGHTWWVDGPDS